MRKYRIQFDGTHYYAEERAGWLFPVWMFVTGTLTGNHEGTKRRLMAAVEREETGPKTVEELTI